MKFINKLKSTYPVFFTENIFANIIDNFQLYKFSKKYLLKDLLIAAPYYFILGDIIQYGAERFLGNTMTLLFIILQIMYFIFKSKTTSIGRIVISIEGIFFRPVATTIFGLEKLTKLAVNMKKQLKTNH